MMGDMVAADAEVQADPQVLAFGRFKLTQDGAMLWASARLNLCERCSTCGCGDEPVTRAIPMAMATMLQGVMNGTGKAKGKLKGLTGRG